MVVAADDVGDAHVVVIDHHGEHVGGIAIASQQHEIVEILVLPDHAALHLVLDHGLAGLGRPEPDRGFYACGRFGRVAVPPQAVIEAGAAFRAGLFPHRRELFRGGVAAVSLAAGQQLLGDLPVPRGAGELVDDVAIPVEFEPFQAVQDRGDRGIGRSFPVGVLDAQQHLAAELPGIEPVEQRGAGPPDMEKAGRRGSKAGDDGIGHDIRGSRTKGACGKRGGV